MSQIDAIEAALKQFSRVSVERDGARVTTQCMYPSNSYVQVLVRGGAETFYVSDEGGAVSELEAAGAWLEKPDRLMAQIVASMGLIASNGIIMTNSCTSAELAMAIAAVANASKQVAEWLFAHVRVQPAQDFKEVVSNFLRTSFSAVHSEMIVGHSNKPHKFENIISLPNNQRLVVDPVINDRSSINSRVVANLDLRAAGYRDLDQRIVYDDREDWKAEDLNILQVGAPVIPYTRATQVLDRLAHRIN